MDAAGAVVGKKSVSFGDEPAFVPKIGAASAAPGFEREVIASMRIS